MSTPRERFDAAPKTTAADAWRFTALLALLSAGIFTSCASPDADAAGQPAKTSATRPGAATAAAKSTSPTTPSTTASTSSAKSTSPAPTRPAPARPASTTPVNLNTTFASWGLVRQTQAPAGTALWRKPSVNASVELRRDKAFAVINGTRVWFGTPFTQVGRNWQVSRADFDNTLLPVLAPVSTLAAARPKPPPVRHVFLDPGHGGKDVGCENEALRLNEKTLVLDVARRVKHLLERRGLKVTLSRTTDTFVDLSKRAELAKRAGADVFVSIHFNAQGAGAAATGIETYTLAPQGQNSTNAPKGSTSAAALAAREPGHAHSAANIILGHQLQSALTAKTSAADRGVRRGRLAVLRLAPCPAVLVECGFLPNAVDGAKIKQAVHREKIAQGIAEGILRYKALVTPTPAPATAPLPATPAKPAAAPAKPAPPPRRR
jgi:N-acetylmuramoyl-L-alanine amidase